ncbi:MAG: hypothetical protein U5J78_03040 [Parasphingorhabdus sp.]|nr:hypothetical protein [Parasphingorhabdus sp.]
MIDFAIEMARGKPTWKAGRETRARPDCDGPLWLQAWCDCDLPPVVSGAWRAPDGAVRDRPETGLPKRSSSSRPVLAE